MLNYFNFKPVENGQVLVTNDFGRYLFLSRDEFRCLLTGDFSAAEELKEKLEKNLFLIKPVDLFSHETANDLRNMKQYVFGATALHIFVLTTACNLQCVYCQAQDQSNKPVRMMRPEVARAAVDVALQSPVPKLTFEFQGGEPLLNFPVMYEIIEYTRAHCGTKAVSFTLVSNLSLLTPEILDKLLEYGVSICTSLDGPAVLHDKNRVAIQGASSYAMMERGAQLLRSRNYPFSAIQTTTRYSLAYAKEIVREYRKMGAPGIFLRPLTPLGFAKKQWTEIGYTAEEWLAFYQEAFSEILQINRQGIRFPEQHAVYFLKKILHGFSENYMELRSPCGASLGQLAYYADGNVYTCDEARMVAEAGDPAFRLGNVFDDSYQDLMESGTCRAVCAASVLESTPGCCDCVYQPYCGICPVVNYAMEGDIFPRTAQNYRCQIYGGMLDFLFHLLHENHADTIGILKSWVEEDMACANTEAE